MDIVSYRDGGLQYLGTQVAKQDQGIKFRAEAMRRRLVTAIYCLDLAASAVLGRRRMLGGNKRFSLWVGAQVLWPSEQPFHEHGLVLRGDDLGTR